MESKHVDGKHTYYLQDVFDSIAGSSNVADGHKYSNIRKLVEKNKRVISWIDKDRTSYFRYQEIDNC